MRPTNGARGYSTPSLLFTKLSFSLFSLFSLFLCLLKYIFFFPLPPFLLFIYNTFSSFLFFFHILSIIPLFLSLFLIHIWCSLLVHFWLLTFIQTLIPSPFLSLSHTNINSYAEKMVNLFLTYYYYSPSTKNLLYSILSIKLPSTLKLVSYNKSYSKLFHRYETFHL